MKWLHRVFIANNARLWTNIVFVVATVKVAITPLKEISEFVWISWMAIAGGIELTKRVIAAKTGVVEEEPQQPMPAEAATDVEPKRKHR